MRIDSQQYKIRIEKHMELIEELRMYYVKELTNIEEEIEFMKDETRKDEDGIETREQA